MWSGRSLLQEFGGHLLGSLHHSHSHHSQDTDISTTAEDFKVFGRPEYRRILPEHVDDPQCQYPTGFSFSHLRFGEVRAPNTSGEYGIQRYCTTPAKPDVPPRVTELSGCTGTAPRSDLTVPEQPVSPVPTVSLVPPTSQHPRGHFSYPTA